jgi:hypothetical protein
LLFVPWLGVNQAAAASGAAEPGESRVKILWREDLLIA